MPKDKIQNWSVAEFKTSLIQDILGLRAQVFSDNTYNYARWNWEYEQNPQGPFFISLAVDNKNHQKLAGHYAVISYQIKSGDDSIQACQSLDTFTDPEFRNQGIFVGLANEVFSAAEKKDVRLIFGFPNINSFPGFVKKLNFQTPFSLYHYIKPLRLGYFLRRIPLIGRAELLNRIRLSFCICSKKYQTTTSEKVPDDWESLYENFSKQSFIHLNRTRSYMQWRYENCPDRTYKFLEIRADNILCGCVVIRTNGHTGYIVDIIGANQNIYPDILKCAVQIFIKLGVHSIVTYLQPSHPLEKVFTNFSFFKRGNGTPILRKIF